MAPPPSISTASASSSSDTFVVMFPSLGEGRVARSTRAGRGHATVQGLPPRGPGWPHCQKSTRVSRVARPARSEGLGHLLKPDEATPKQDPLEVHSLRR